MSAPGFASEWDQQRAAALGVARRRATALLLFAVAVFLAVRQLTEGEGFWGYVIAGAEASVVGGVADWFAVTALFRHPLGLPIPHTAIIPRGKDVFGRGLGEFIARNFLEPEHLTDRLDEADVAARFGRWLGDPEHAKQAARQAAVILAGVANALDDEQVQAGVQAAVESRLLDVEVAPLVGATIDVALDGGHHQVLLDAALRGIATTIDENEHLLRSRIRKESPWWVPEPIDELVLDKVKGALHRLVAEVLADPDHDFRKLLDEKANELAGRMRTSPDLIARGEEIKKVVIEHPAFRAWTEGLWDEIKAYIGAAASDDDSQLRARLEMALRTLGSRLRDEPVLRHQVNTWTASIVKQLAAGSNEQVAELIASTVERWDAQETSRRLELLLGRDLQFIRINGTLVGGLVGLVIHAVGEVL